MKRVERRARADRILAGYATGPGATSRARDIALARAQDARTVVLVEGISDLMALEAVAQRLGRDLHSEGTVVLPVGGAHAFDHHFDLLSRQGVVVRGLVDKAEEEIVRGPITRGVDNSTGSDPRTLRVFVCIEDLEDELIRAVGASAVEEILDREGDLGSFRTLQKQPAWRDGGVTAQLRRFLGAGARRKLRYARLLCLELDPEKIPRPLVRVLEV